MGLRKINDYCATVSANQLGLQLQLTITSNRWEHLITFWNTPVRNNETDYTITRLPGWLRDLCCGGGSQKNQVFTFIYLFQGVSVGGKNQPRMPL